MLTNKRKEKISAFLDDDMHSDELMSFSLSAEADDAETARRYQMVGDALRGEMSDASFIDVSHAVREALAGDESYALEEAHHSITENATDKSPVTDGAHDSNHDGSKGFFDLSAWFKPVAGMAVAASVAVVMVVTLSEQDAGGLSPVVATTQPVAAPTVQLASDNGQPQNVNVPNAAGNQNVDQRIANQRLVNQHLEFATQDTLQGRLPLVRAVSFEAGK